VTAPAPPAGAPSPEAIYTKTDEEERAYSKWKADQIFDGGNKKRWRELTEIAIYMEYLRGKNDAECDTALALDAATDAALEKAAKVAMDARADEEYGHAAFRCVQIAQDIRALKEAK